MPDSQSQFNKPPISSKDLRTWLDNSDDVPFFDQATLERFADGSETPFERTLLLDFASDNPDFLLFLLEIRGERESARAWQAEQDRRRLRSRSLMFGYAAAVALVFCGIVGVTALSTQRKAEQKSGEVAVLRSDITAKETQISALKGEIASEGARKDLQSKVIALSTERAQLKKELSDALERGTHKVDNGLLKTPFGYAVLLSQAEIEALLDGKLPTGSDISKLFVESRGALEAKLLGPKIGYALPTSTVFSWGSVSGADGYQLEVFSGPAVVYKSKTTSTQAEVDLSKLPRNHVLRWQAAPEDGAKRMPPLTSIVANKKAYRAQFEVLSDAESKWVMKMAPAERKANGIVN